MFKKIITTTALITLSFGALANGYCNSRQTQNDVSRCYQQLINTNMVTINRLMAEIKPRLTAQQYQNLTNQSNDFFNRVENGCRGDGECIANSLKNQINDLSRIKHQVTKR